MASFDGNTVATRYNVRRYLIENYTNHEDDTPMSVEEAGRLIDAGQEYVDTAQRLGSYAYYPGDEIAKANGLTYIGTEDDEDDEE